MITRIEESDSDLVVWLEGVRRPLYWPRELAPSSLYQVVSEAFYPDDWHYYEVDETGVREGEIIVDCGAAEGLFSLLTADRARKVYAIEPLPRFVEALHRTFRDVPNVEILHCALGEEPRTAWLDPAGIASSIGAAPNAAEVEVTTLDELFAERGERITYIKADLEGHDLSMLRGAANVIERDQPRIAITTYHRPHHAREMERLLRRIEPRYKVRRKGIFQGTGCPVMLHAWVD